MDGEATYDDAINEAISEGSWTKVSLVVGKLIKEHHWVAMIHMGEILLTNRGMFADAMEIMSLALTPLADLAHKDLVDEINDCQIHQCLNIFLHPNMPYNQSDSANGGLRSSLLKRISEIQLVQAWHYRLRNSLYLSADMLLVLSTFLICLYPTDLATLSQPDLTELLQQIGCHLSNASHEEHKAVDLYTIRSIERNLLIFMTSYYGGLNTNDGDMTHSLPCIVYEAVTLPIVGKFLKSPYLEKRLQAMNEIKRMVVDAENATSDNKPIMAYENPVYMQEQVAQHLISMCFWDELLGPNMHVQTLIRAAEAVILLARTKVVDERCCRQLWNAMKGQHESVHHVLLQLMAEVVQHSTNPMVQRYIDSQLVDLNPIDLLDQPTQQLVVGVGQAMTTVIDDSQSTETNSLMITNEFISIKLLFEAIEEPPNQNAVIAQSLAQRLLDVVGGSSYYVARLFLQRSVEGLSRPHCGSMALLWFLQRTIALVAINSTDEADNILLDLDDKYDLKKVATKLYMDTQDSRRMESFTGPLIYDAKNTPWWSVGLELLFYTIQKLPNNGGLDANILDNLWAACTDRPVDGSEQDYFLQWLTSLLALPHALPSPLLHHLFENNLPHLATTTMGLGAFRFFTQVFLRANQTKVEEIVNVNVNDKEPNKDLSLCPNRPVGIIYRRIGEGLLEGIHQLWRLVLQ
eukprot:Ihof_evm1s1155 gene=Ihof_evmTU1s1155